MGNQGTESRAFGLELARAEAQGRQDLKAKPKNRIRVGKGWLLQKKTYGANRDRLAGKKGGERTISFLSITQSFYSLAC